MMGETHKQQTSFLLRPPFFSGETEAVATIASREPLSIPLCFPSDKERERERERERDCIDHVLELKVKKRQEYEN